MAGMETVAVLPLIQTNKGTGNVYHPSRGQWTSLPPLPRVPQRDVTVRLWGDPTPGNAIHAGGSAIVNDVKKPVQRDVSYGNAFRAQRLPKSRTVEVFPRHDENRVGPDGCHVLSQPTRAAIDTCITKLYRTHRYCDQYKDQTDFIIRRLRRDAQHREEEPRYDEARTCTRILNHPDPCYVCQPAGSAHHRRNFFDEGTSYSEYERSWVKSTDHPTCHSEISHSDRIYQRNTGREATSNCSQRWSYYYGQKLWVKGDSKKGGAAACNKCGGTSLKSAAKCSCKSSKSDMTSLQPTAMAQFGPWDEMKVGESEQEEIHHFNGMWPNYHYHSDWKCELKDCQICQESMKQRDVQPANGVCDDADVATVEKTSTSAARCNRWTFRDENNLRVPCIAHVIGTLNKTAAHQR